MPTSLGLFYRSPAASTPIPPLIMVGAAGREVVDLTISNPTRVGLHYDAEAILQALGNPRSMDYDAQPRGLREAREARREGFRRCGSRDCAGLCICHPRTLTETARIPTPEPAQRQYVWISSKNQPSRADCHWRAARKHLAVALVKLHHLTQQIATRFPIRT